MYEEKDREQMNQDEREERKVNWTTPQKLEEGRSTDESRSRETEPLQNHPSGENAVPTGQGFFRGQPEI